MSPVDVLDALDAMGRAPDLLEAIGQHIVAVEVVGVDDLATAGLSGRDIIAVRRALDPSVRCWSCSGRTRHEADWVSVVLR